MRLGQLSRKLGISTSEIIGFLASKNVAISEDSNTKIEDGHTAWVIQKYAPELLEIPTVIIPEEKPQPVPTGQAGVELVETPTPTAPELDSTAVTPSEQPITDNEQPLSDQLPEVIKAPKIELSGLKVLGKIEIPEKKKKDVSPEENENPSDEIESKPRPDRRSFSPRKEFDDRPRKNPVTLQREKEEREAERKRKEAMLIAKERKAYHYHSKIKVQSASKKMRVINEEVEQIDVPVEEKPTTLWGKFKKWLRT
jgi:hypothetical protein